MKKRIGILGSTLAATESAIPRQILNRAYVWAVERAGCIPLILPVTRELDAVESYLGAIDGLLLSGGVDVAPACYGQPPHPQLGTVDADRDTIELPLIRAALEQNMPLFAICRGLQTLNVALGGTLYQDIPSEYPTDLHHQQSDRHIPRDEFTHSIEIVPDSRLRAIVGAGTMQTNSLHHQALRDVASPLLVTARASDGIIEAAESPAHRYVVGVQFHPEETAARDEKSRRLFEAFAQAL